MGGKGVNVVEQGQGDEVVGTTTAILASLAGADEDAVTGAKAEVTYLRVELFAMPALFERMS